MENRTEGAGAAAQPGVGKANKLILENQLAIMRALALMPLLVIGLTGRYLPEDDDGDGLPGGKSCDGMIACLDSRIVATEAALLAYPGIPLGFGPQVPLTPSTPSSAVDVWWEQTAEGYRCWPVTERAKERFSPLYGPGPVHRFPLTWPLPPADSDLVFVEGHIPITA